jgi:site-specific DNA-methyltransferase (adenine-specific)
MSDDLWCVMRGDSLRVLSELPDETVDAVITDPPYSSGGAFRADRQGSAKGKYLSTGSAALGRVPDFYGDSRTERGLHMWSSLWMAEAWRVTKDGGAIAVFCDWRSLPIITDCIQAGGWIWRGLGVWIKPPGRSRPTSGGLWNDTEYIAWGSRGPRSGECLPGTWQVAAPSSAQRMHPTEKPTAILSDLVRLAPPGGLVLDPFCGSGSTGVACITGNRQFLGVELSPEWVVRARQRLHAIESHGADVDYGGHGLFSTEDLPS